MIDLVNKSDLFASLPAPWPMDLLPAIRAEVAASRRKLVVLDDDPTGTQTVYDVPVLTTWEPEELTREFANDLPCFYILTNTRAFPSSEAVRINQEIARNLTMAAAESPGRHDFVVVSRGDSTLRGHFPAETDALGRALMGGGTKTPPVLLVPYFEAGGRYTVNDVHYVAENDSLIPAGETPFAQDAAFGYRSSNLRDWVEEKTGGRVKAAEVTSISLDDLRIAGPDVVKANLLSLMDGEVCIAKRGITSSDLATHALGVKRAMVLGQILPGIPVWELGNESKLPGVPYVVFPGNVGGPDVLAELASKFNRE